ncbi:MAG TPA: GNAT family N-acetyltransferase [Pyrinomonadaceae bacterium]|nr:GNAT family N-acetyltransferase [Pyrinomonadaceae bacterium]
MADHILDNPIWNSLVTCHSQFSTGGDLAKRYPAEIGPFIGVPTISKETFSELARLIRSEERLYLVGLDEPFPTDLTIEHHEPITQMVAGERATASKIDKEVIVLSEADAPDMLELIELTFPGYFRAETRKLGKYLGIRDNGKLVAMAGERMSMTGFREVSAVCTHPDYRGRGYANHLMAQLINNMFGEGITPFLHVDIDNAKAKRVYEKLGFVERRDMPLKAVSL